MCIRDDTEAIKQIVKFIQTDTEVFAELILKLKHADTEV